MHVYLIPLVLLTISNVFMTFAWYGHLNGFNTKAIWVVILAAWGIAFFEYCFMIPANRYGYLHGLPAGKLKVMQEAITLAVFLVFARFYLGEKLTWNYFAGFALVLVGVGVMFWGRKDSSLPPPPPPSAETAVVSPVQSGVASRS